MREFFVDPAHWVYSRGGSPSQIGPDSVYHVMQLEVLFEDCHFHRLGFAASYVLREEGFLDQDTVETSTGLVGRDVASQRALRSP